MIIDGTYFIGDISLPSNTQMDALIAHLGEVVESDILKKMLGYELFKDYKANSGDARWVAFVEGYEYTLNGKVVKWEGLKNTLKVSLLAYFTYAEIVKATKNVYGDSGATGGNTEKAVIVSPDILMVSSYNKGVDLYGSRWGNEQEPTAYNFLTYSGLDFDGLDFTEIRPLNTLFI